MEIEKNRKNEIGRATSSNEPPIQKRKIEEISLNEENILEGFVVIDEKFVDRSHRKREENTGKNSNNLSVGVETNVWILFS